MIEDASEKPGGGKWWKPFLWIVLASAAAHLWCLKSQFYMDDMVIIRDSEVIRSGSLSKSFSSLWTHLGYVIQFKLFGLSPVGYHAVNWLLHTAAACALFGVAKPLVKSLGGDGVALFAAMLFAVHPLASEIPNYARTQDLAWVTLFSLLGCRALIGFQAEGRPVWLLGAVLALAGATLSKGPGLFHASMMMAAVGSVTLRGETWSRCRRYWVWIAVAALAGACALWFSGYLPSLLRSTHKWSEPRFISHAYTLARVFWEFAWRAVVPIQLCSDHQIAETVVLPGAGWLDVKDGVAKACAAGMLGLAVLSLVLCVVRSTRIFGLCLFLFVATILFRVAYVVPEFMPEYRIYPGMPWFCLGASIFLAAIWKRLPGDGSPRVFALLILLPCVWLSASRSRVWHDLDRLCADVLKQYPGQGRAVWELHDRDAAKGDWRKIIDRQRNVWPTVFQAFVRNYRELLPKRDLGSGHFALADIACNGRYAIALAHVEGPAAGVMEIRRLEARMRQLGIEPRTNRTIWGYFHHARATVLEMAGDDSGALESMKFEGVFKFTSTDIQRLERKIAAKQP